MLKETTLVLLMNIKTSIVLISSILAAFFAPIIPLVLIIFGAIMLDTVFGIIKAKKLGIYTSRGFGQIARKICLYGGAIVISFLAEKYIVGDIVGIFCKIPFIGTKVISAILLIVEGVSINENWEAISGVNLWKKAKLILTRTKELKKEIEDLVGDDKKKEEPKKEDNIGNGDESNH
jgi:hypothetical protein